MWVLLKKDRMDCVLHVLRGIFIAYQQHLINNAYAIDDYHRCFPEGERPNAAEWFLGVSTHTLRRHPIHLCYERVMNMLLSPHSTFVRDLHELLERRMRFSPITQTENLQDRFREKKALIAFQNGIYDLRHQILRPGMPEDFVWRNVGYEYVDWNDVLAHPHTFSDQSLKWKTFFSETFSEEGAIWIQRILSLWISGRQMNSVFLLTGPFTRRKRIFILLLKRLLNLDGCASLDSNVSSRTHSCFGDRSARLPNNRVHDEGSNDISSRISLDDDCFWTCHTTIAPWQHSFGSRRLVHIPFKTDSPNDSDEPLTQSCTEWSQSLMSALIYLYRKEDPARNPASIDPINLLQLPSQIRSLNDAVIHSNDAAITFVKCALISSELDFMELQDIWQLYLQYIEKISGNPSPSRISISSLQLLLKSMFRPSQSLTKGANEKTFFPCVAIECILSREFDDGSRFKDQTKSAAVTKRNRRTFQALTDLYNTVELPANAFTDSQSIHSLARSDQASAMKGVAQAGSENDFDLENNSIAESVDNYS